MDDLQDLVCKDEQQRRAIVRAHPTLNGIDYVEVDPADHTLLRVFFLKPLPVGAYGIPGNLTVIVITGGVRIVNIKPLAAVRRADGHLDVTLTQGGDYSVYTLAVNVPELDPFLRRVEFSFMASCPVDVDCPRPPECPPPALPEPLLDYLAKDYASFRRLMIDLLPHLNPQFVERNPADLGIALIELLAYTGDHLSYYQDAVANEMYLDTARQRISARRHVRLIDYRMHDGRNAWTYLHVAVSAPATLPQGSMALSRIVTPLAHDMAPPGWVIPADRITAGALDKDPALAGAVVFETTHPVDLSPVNNEILIHTWGDDACCLGPGASEVYLYAVPSGTTTAVLPILKRGDFLLFEEVKGPTTGLAADADVGHRQVVRIDEDPEATTDPLFGVQLVNGELQRWSAVPPGQPTLPLLRVHWSRQDALQFPLCLSAQPARLGPLHNISVARGNVALADHGFTFGEVLPQDPPAAADPPFRLALSRGPQTMQCPPAPAAGALRYSSVTGRLETPRYDLGCDVREAQPACTLFVTFPTGAGAELWTPVPDLLDSPPFAGQFVAEVDNNGLPVLRFGDGEFGREVAGAVSFRAVYRIGNGPAGNVGAEALAHLALPAAVNVPVLAVRNPLPAQGGVAAETIEEVRQLAPAAVRAEQFRAVTEADYAAAALKLPDVAGAVARFRWTGSWYTVFVSIDPRDSAGLVVDPLGHIHLAPTLAAEVRLQLNRYRLAGYDLEIRPPAFVPLEIEIEICAKPGYFRSQVKQAVAAALSSGPLPGGRRGFFDPRNFTFGLPVYLSRLYAAVERVEGVESAVAKTFKRFGRVAQGELAAGMISVGPDEIAQLQNDPNFIEQGVLRITAVGGKG